MLAELERLGTIGDVARELRLTAPGVSMQIASLERDVRLKLTQRRGRNLTLTPAGRLLARHGHDIVDMLSLAERESSALRDGAAGTYRVAAFPSAARTVVADTWSTLLGDPGIGLRLEFVEQEPLDAIAALHRGDVEVAVTHAYSNTPSPTTAGELFSSRVAVETVWLAVNRDDPVVGTPVAGTPVAADLGDYAHHDWIIPHRQWSCHEMVRRACGLAGFEPRSVAEATDFSVILALVSAGAGVALVPQLAITELPGGVLLRPLATPVHRHLFVVTRPSTATDPGVRRLTDLLATSAGKFIHPDRLAAPPNAPAGGYLQPETARGSEMVSRNRRPD